MNQSSNSQGLETKPRRPSGSVVPRPTEGTGSARRKTSPSQPGGNGLLLSQPRSSNSKRPLRGNPGIITTPGVPRMIYFRYLAFTIPAPNTPLWHFVRGADGRGSAHGSRVPLPPFAEHPRRQEGLFRRADPEMLS